MRAQARQDAGHHERQRQYFQGRGRTALPDETVHECKKGFEQESVSGGRRLIRFHSMLLAIEAKTASPAQTAPNRAHAATSCCAVPISSVTAADVAKIKVDGQRLWRPQPVVQLHAG